MFVVLQSFERLEDGLGMSGEKPLAVVADPHRRPAIVNTRHRDGEHAASIWRPYLIALLMRLRNRRVIWLCSTVTVGKGSCVTTASDFIYRSFQLRDGGFHLVV